MRTAKKREEPRYPHGKPSTQCITCKGTGEQDDQYVTGLFISGYYTKKRCFACKGTGKIEAFCVLCRGDMGQGLAGYYCANSACIRYGLLSLVFFPNKEPT